MYKGWLGKRVVLWVTRQAHIHYVGTLVKGEGMLIRLEKVRPLRESRKMPDMIANLSSTEYSHLTLVDNPEDDPTGGK